MNNIIWETTLYENDDVNVGQMEIQFCCKCREEIVKECYTIERMNMKPLWRRKENYHKKCYTEKDAEIRLSKRQPDLVIMKNGDREEIYLNELPKIKIGDTMPSFQQHFS